jgi:hypothetical protein
VKTLENALKANVCTDRVFGLSLDLDPGQIHSTDLADDSHSRSSLSDITTHLHTTQARTSLILMRLSCASVGTRLRFCISHTVMEQQDERIHPATKSTTPR